MYRQSEEYWKELIPTEVKNSAVQTSGQEMSASLRQQELYEKNKNETWQRWHEGCLEWFETWENEKIVEKS